MCPAPVKGRSEAGRRREEAALLTRRRIVEAALALFLDRGYVATTVEAIARGARVAPATVYQAFGSKPAVLAAALDVAIAGDTQPLAVLDRDWVRAVGREPDPVRRLVRVVSHTTEIAARTAAIKEVIRDAAATEPDMRDLIHRDDEQRRRTQRALVDLIRRDRPPSGPAAARKAADSFSALMTSEAYALVVGRLGWTMAEWRRWLVRILQREILSDHPLEQPLWPSSAARPPKQRPPSRPAP